MVLALALIFISGVALSLHLVNISYLTIYKVLL